MPDKRLAKHLAECIIREKIFWYKEVYVQEINRLINNIGNKETETNKVKARRAKLHSLYWQLENLGQ